MTRGRHYLTVPRHVEVMEHTGPDSIIMMIMFWYASTRSIKLTSTSNYILTITSTLFLLDDAVSFA